MCAFYIVVVIACGCKLKRRRPNCLGETCRANRWDVGVEACPSHFDIVIVVTQADCVSSKNIIFAPISTTVDKLVGEILAANNGVSVSEVVVDSILPNIIHSFDTIR
jgi:hypothetical protein